MPFTLAYTFEYNTEPHRSARVGTTPWLLSALSQDVPQCRGSCHKQVTSILQQFQEEDLLLVAIDTKRHDSHCGCKVFYMCNSFVTNKRGNTRPKTHKKMYNSFRSKTDTNKSKWVGWAKTRIVQSSLGTHYGKLTFEQFGREPWPKVIDKPSQKGKTKCRACETTTRESCLTCHHQKGMWK